MKLVLLMVELCNSVIIYTQYSGSLSVSLQANIGVR